MNVSIDVGNNTAQMLKGLADKLGLTVQQVFPYFVKQEIINGIEGVLAYLLFVLLSLVGLRWAQKEYKKNPVEEFEFIRFFCVCLLIVSTIIFILGNSIGEIVNPQYYAIKDIVQFAAHMKQ